MKQTGAAWRDRCPKWQSWRIIVDAMLGSIRKTLSIAHCFFLFARSARSILVRRGWVNYRVVRERTSLRLLARARFLYQRTSFEFSCFRSGGVYARRRGKKASECKASHANAFYWGIFFLLTFVNPDTHTTRALCFRGFFSGSLGVQRVPPVTYTRVEFFSGVLNLYPLIPSAFLSKKLFFK